MRSTVAAGRDGKDAAAKPAYPEWSQLLVDAVTKPGLVSTAYSRFWNYSVGNQLLALWQCLERKLDPGPIHTFAGWKDVGRHVRRGQRAIILCMPVSVKAKKQQQLTYPSVAQASDSGEQQLDGSAGSAAAGNAPATVTVFMYKPHWFLLSQTDGKEYVPTALPEWSEEIALAALKVTRVPFTHTNGNCQGYATGQLIAVSPVAAMPHKTLIHEIAHVLLGHTTEDPGLLDDHELTPKILREAEAESVALIVCESLNLAGAEFSRGYIQHWLAGQTIPDRSAQKIFRVADQILKAGYPGNSTAPAETIV